MDLLATEFDVVSANAAAESFLSQASQSLCSCEVAIEIDVGIERNILDNTVITVHGNKKK